MTNLSTSLPVIALVVVLLGYYLRQKLRRTKVYTFRFDDSMDGIAGVAVCVNNTTVKGLYLLLPDGSALEVVAGSDPQKPEA